MLNHLYISNFALIDELEMNLSQGLTTITGETGAGKSIILGALQLLLGERADMSVLKDKTKKSVVESLFLLKNKRLEKEIQKIFNANDLDFDQEIIIRREILPSAKSRAFINDSPVKLAVLKEISSQFIDIHSQFKTSDLFQSNYILHVLDIISNQTKEVDSFQKEFAHYKDLIFQKNQINQELQEKRNQQDYQNFLLEELENASLLADELEELENKQKTFTHAENILKALNSIQQTVKDDSFGIEAALQSISKQFNDLIKYSEVFQNVQTRFESSKIELFDVFQELESKIENIEINPIALTEITHRLDFIHQLLRKHNVSTIGELISLRTNLQNQSNEFDSLTQQIQGIESEIQSLEQSLEQKAQTIHQNRIHIKPKIEKNLVHDLARLGIIQAKIDIQIKTSSNLKINGKDNVLFLFTANQGIELKEIEKAVSGGERSRIMLSMKHLLAQHQSLPTLILDEIDTGVSGKIAHEMGDLMHQMAQKTQILSITHLPQVAAKGNAQFKVFKEQNPSKTQIQKLSHQERVIEIASLLSADKISEAAIHQAKELLAANTK